MVYVAFVVDVFSRAIVGWAAATTKHTTLVLDALQMALWRREHAGHKPGPGLVHHSDAGSQGSQDFERACRRLGVSRSRGAVGTSADNAAAESFNASLKRETLQGARHWPETRTARLAVFGWITRYNTSRRHSATSHRSTTRKPQPA